MATPGELRQTATDLIEAERGLPTESVNERVSALTDATILEALKAAVAAMKAQEEATRESLGGVKIVENGITRWVRPPMDHLIIGAGAFTVLDTHRAVKAQEEAIETVASVIGDREVLLARDRAIVEHVIAHIEDQIDPDRRKAAESMATIHEKKQAAIENAEAYRDTL